MALTKSYTSSFGMEHPNAYYKITDVSFSNRSFMREIDLEGNPLENPMKNYGDIAADVGIWHDKSAALAGAAPVGGFTHRMTYQPTQGNILNELYNDMKINLDIMAGAQDA
jgi:hypothetical protein